MILKHFKGCKVPNGTIILGTEPGIASVENNKTKQTKKLVLEARRLKSKASFQYRKS